MKLWRRKTARALIFNPKTGLFLLTKGALPPFRFHLPGGGINKNESAEDAVKRELKEELNIQTKDISSLTFISKQDECTMLIPHTSNIFIIEINNVTLKLSWEICRVKWVSMTELKRCVYLDEPVLKGIEGLALIKTVAF